MKTVILASQSKARKLLFSSLGIPFITMPASIDEKSIRDKNLKKRAEKIARTKGEKIAAEHNGVIISCDTFSSCEGKVLEKPDNVSEAKKMLRFLSGRKAVNYTGFCYIDHSKQIDFSTTIVVNYEVRQLYPGEINQYINEFPVAEWAAAFALVYPYITTFISKINGSYTGLSYGLPTELLIPLLKKSGFEPKPQR